MASWDEFTAAAPDLAARVEARFRGRRHHTMGTVRADGGPRLSGTEVDFGGGQLRIGMMTGTRRGADLRRDPRVAVHAQNVDPPEGDDAGWVGEAKVAGVAVPVAMYVDVEGEAFVIDLVEVVHTGIGPGGDHLVIERWTPDGGVQRFERR
jgi:hypothetical protein